MLPALSHSQRDWIRYQNHRQLEDLDETFLLRVLGFNWWRFRQLRDADDIAGHCMLLSSIRNDNEHAGQNELDATTWLRAFDSALCVMMAVDGPQEDIESIRSVRQELLVGQVNQHGRSRIGRALAVTVCVCVLALAGYLACDRSRQISVGIKPLSLTRAYSDSVRI